MEGSYSDKYAFSGEWYDGQASLLQRFNIFWYPVDDTMEMYDLKRRKTFMRRMKVDGLSLTDLYIGSTLVIHGRLIKITGFACTDTHRRLHRDLEVMFALIKPLPIHTVGKIIDHFYKGGLRVTKMKMSCLHSDIIEKVYGKQAKLSSYPFHLDHLQGQKSIGIELVGRDSVEVAHKLAGDPDPLNAQPGTIRNLYGVDAIKNCLFLASSTESAQNTVSLFFEHGNLQLTATLSNCTLCIIKPHAIRESKLGSILTAIDMGGFDVTALNMFMVEKENAGEFYEVYKGINLEYQGMVDDLASGSCVAMEVVAKDKTVNSAVEFRKLVGPCDPEIARMLRPNTLRAKFGVTKVKNAVHCSDLSEDGLLEVEYFFKIL